ncbi:excalibur calcium-binding domain-containing protein [Deinococcus sp. HMF7604]|uniref:excalibur calcium-binding domain-containing protein n=1 Tax=Deinococcus betulae TaxID=2873312 RepID=UPI001CCB4882|nr:excalibur calcium-binding domain-containing protein [Deinococcus betulae]MBZ9753495.1 excalibur calcium-binding domain-containing protein [Deinococcus betulae]
MTSLLLGLGTASAQATPPGALTLRFLDVGQGDAVLITSPEGKSLLYDGGRSAARMATLLTQYSVKSLDLVAASHGDADHITGLVTAVQRFKPKYFLNNGLAPTTQIWQQLVGAVQAAGTQGLLAKAQVINLGSVKVTVLPPPPGMPKTEQNLNSIGLLVEYGSFRALMTGDSETAETTGWLRQAPASVFGPIDVYKSIHHGAKNGDNSRWLAAVRPTNVVIGVGPNNYGHPTAEALTLYKKAGAAIYRTDLNGTVTVTVQPGGQYTLTTEKGTGVKGTGAAVTSPAQPPAPPSSPVRYANCAAVRAAGKAPLLRGQPGYSTALDRDGDGRACE